MCVCVYTAGLVYTVTSFARRCQQDGRFRGRVGESAGPRGRDFDSGSLAARGPGASSPPPSRPAGPRCSRTLSRSSARATHVSSKCCSKVASIPPAWPSSPTQAPQRAASAFRGLLDHVTRAAWTAAPKGQTSRRRLRVAYRKRPLRPVADARAVTGASAAGGAAVPRGRGR